MKACRSSRKSRKNSALQLKSRELPKHCEFFSVINYQDNSSSLLIQPDFLVVTFVSAKTTHFYNCSMYLSFSTCPTVHASLDYCCSSTCAKINFTKLLKDDSVSRKLLSISRLFFLHAHIVDRFDERVGCAGDRWRRDK